MLLVRDRPTVWKQLRYLKGQRIAVVLDLAPIVQQQSNFKDPVVRISILVNLKFGIEFDPLRKASGPEEPPRSGQRYQDGGDICRYLTDCLYVIHGHWLPPWLEVEAMALSFEVFIEQEGQAQSGHQKLMLDDVQCFTAPLDVCVFEIRSVLEAPKRDRVRQGV